MTQLDCGSFAQKSNLTGPDLVQSAVDRLFIASKNAPEGVPMPHSNGNSLCRAQFWELCLRLAQTKLKETKVFDTFHQSVEALINKFILPNYPTESWQGWRESELWCMDVNDVFEVNIPILEQVYKSFLNPQHKFPDLADMVTMCMAISPCGLSEVEVKFCYAMCKMTIVNEAANYKEYGKLQFVEFLEFIGRLAHAKFKHNGNEAASIPLAQKIEFMLDDILAGFNLQRKEVEI